MRGRGGVALVQGPMGSGKTELLIELAQRATERERRVQAFKPELDTRYGIRPELVSHNGQRYPAFPVKRAVGILNLLLPGITTVIIDEGQLFDSLIVPAVKRLVMVGFEVVVAGLDYDFRGEPFGPMPQLEQAVRGMGGEIVTLTATCAVCGGEARLTQRLINGQPAHYKDPVVLVGGLDLYEPRCRDHHQVPGKPRTR